MEEGQTRITIEGVSEDFRRSSQIAILTLGYASMKEFIIKKLEEAQAQAAKPQPAKTPAKANAK